MRLVRFSGAVGEFSVRRIREADWERARSLRLEMLQDTPLAYCESHAEALARPESAWRADARRDEAGAASTRYVAETADGRWVATLGCYFPAPGRADVVAVYVVPAWRGPQHGVADALLAAAGQWAAAGGARELRLHVHEDNARARGYYRRAGFVPTGRTMPYPLDPARHEIEMVRPL